MSRTIGAGPRAVRVTALVVLLVVLGAGLAVLRGSTPPTTTGTYRVLQLNFCGNARNPQCGVLGSTGAPVDALVDLVVRARPDVVMLQEVCRDQVETLRRRAAARGVTLDAGYASVWTDAGSCHDGDQGVAVLAVRPLTGVVVRCLSRCDVPTAVDERRIVLCATSVLLVPTRVCVTHIGGPGLAAEAAALADALDAAARSGPVVVGGDLNAPPTSPVLDLLYASGSAGSRGRFAEADGCRTRAARSSTCNVGTLQAPGADVKLDYVFATTADFVDLDASTVHMAWSDHDAVIAVLHGCPRRDC